MTTGGGTCTVVVGVVDSAGVLSTGAAGGGRYGMGRTGGTAVAVGVGVAALTAAGTTAVSCCSAPPNLTSSVPVSSASSSSPSSRLPVRRAPNGGEGHGAESGVSVSDASTTHRVDRYRSQLSARTAAEAITRQAVRPICRSRPDIRRGSRTPSRGRWFRRRRRTRGRSHHPSRYPRRRARESAHR